MMRFKPLLSMLIPGVICLLSTLGMAQGSDPAEATDPWPEDYPREFNQKKGNYLNYYTERSDVFTNMTPVTLSLEQILFGEEIQIRSGLLNAVVTLREREKRNGSLMSIFGDLNGNPEHPVQITHNDGFVHAYISKGNELYRIETLDGENYIFLVDQSQVQPEGCFDLPEIREQGQKEVESAESVEDRINYVCRIRVLVLYTTAYDNATPDPRGSIQGYMDYTNDSYALSQVNVRMELCYIAETAYNESGDMYLDRNRFRNDADGHMDEVHDVRFVYEADYCHLMTNEGGYTGVAYSINSPNSNDAFCLTNKGNAESIFTFAHEMGHLTGCRHDPYVDPTNTPYPWQHGYVYMNAGANNYRTIMAYGTQCSDAGQSCARVLRWSNPNINFNGVPAGTAGSHHNRRVWNDEDDAKIAFNQPDANETLTGVPHVNNALYGYITAQQTASNSGTILIQGDDYDIVVGTTITLNNGFTVQPGTVLFMDTQTVTTCP